MSKISFVFPGQGSQYVGMGAGLKSELFEEADAILGFKLSEIMFKGSEDELRQTENVQPALLLTSMAVANQLTLKPSVVAGHSLGEYTALCFAGAISFADAIRIVRRRGELMSQATGGGMAAVIGLEIEKVKEVVAGFSGQIVVANDNSDGQVVVSGAVGAIDEFVAGAKGFGAKMAVKLPVSGAFHSPFMANMAGEFENFLRQFRFNEPQIPVISNVTLETFSLESAISLLVRQLTAPVRWRETMKLFEQMGVTELYEIGAKNVLSGLCKRTTPSIKPNNIETQEHISTICSNS